MLICAEDFLSLYYICIRCSLLAQTFGHRETDFQCHVLYRHSQYQSPHKQRTHIPSTHSQFDPSTSNTYTVLYVHKHHAYVTPLSLCKYTLFSKAKIIYLCDRCTFVWQEQLSQNAHGISERDNISSRDPHQYVIYMSISVVENMITTWCWCGIGVSTCDINTSVRCGSNR